MKEEYKSITFKDREYRLYTWNNKPFKEFKCPDGFRWTEAIELIELVNSEHLISNKDKSYFSSRMFNNSYHDIFGAYYNKFGYWCPVNENLNYKDSDGLVVLIQDNGRRN